MFGLENKRLFLFDIDGTLAVGEDLFEGTRRLLEYIDHIGGKAFYITNNSTKSGKDYVKNLKMGNQDRGGTVCHLRIHGERLFKKALC